MTDRSVERAVLACELASPIGIQKPQETVVRVLDHIAGAAIADFEVDDVAVGAIHRIRARLVEEERSGNPKESELMPKLVKQSITLPASAKRLYDMYMSPREHRRITGAKVTIGKRPGSPFHAFGGALSGTILHTVPGRMIVQTWRSTGWRKGDMDSTLVLTFTPKGRSAARIDLVHVNVADQDYKGVSQGWPNYYWKPWRKALRKR